MLKSTLSWVDFSEHDRDHMLQVIRMFAEPETVDELGIGSVRDALADVLFPGTSTIQTRAAYFLFIPWIYVSLEGRRASARDVAELARRREVQLIDALAASDDTRGVIGIEARSKLKRFPSSIYWNGLGVWGIRRFPGSREQYHRSFASSPVGPGTVLTNDDGEPADGVVRWNWHPALPDPPPGFPRRASFRLRPDDADFLQERIQSSAPNSYLAFLVGEGGIFSPETVLFPWQHPRTAHAPELNRRQLAHARNFSLVMHGAALCYNLLLVEARLALRQTDADEERRDTYVDMLEQWWADVKAWTRVVQQWDMTSFWATAEQGNPNIHRRTRYFVETWLAFVREHLGGGHPVDRLVRSQRVVDLLKERERQLKGSRARFYNPHALDGWNGRSGADRLNYRWPVVSDIVLDILNGFAEGEFDAATG